MMFSQPQRLAGRSSRDVGARSAGWLGGLCLAERRAWAEPWRDDDDGRARLLCFAGRDRSSTPGEG